MSAKSRVIVAGVVFLAVSIFLYFTVRFKYVEKDQVGSLVRSTNTIVREYRDMEQRMAAEKKSPSPDDLSGFLARTHRKYPQVALMAITDKALALRLSSKNDRYVRSAVLFESILKDFTQEKFNITRSNPYAVRYYDEKSGGRVEQLKFYIFLTGIGPYRLLVVYPHTVGDSIRTRTALELSLLVLLVVMITAAAYVAAARKREAGTGSRAGAIDLDLGRPAAAAGGSLQGETANVVSDGLSGYIHDLFSTINASCDTDTVSLYIFHPSGRLVKTMELMGKTFLRIDSVSFDTIDVGNEAGRELRNGATMVLEEGRKIIIPLVYNNTFLGAVNAEKRDGFAGNQVRDIRNALAGILKNIHDYIIVNDVMTDPATGLHSRIYFNLKYNECVKAWKGKGKDFSVMFVRLFDAVSRVGEEERNRIIKLVAPALTGIVKDDGYICCYDDCLAVIMPDMNSRKAGGIVKQFKNVLMKYRIRINDDTIMQIQPSIGLSSADGAGKDSDPAALAKGLIAASPV